MYERSRVNVKFERSSPSRFTFTRNLFNKCLYVIYSCKSYVCKREKYTRQWKTTLERTDDRQCWEHSFPSNEAGTQIPAGIDDICWLSLLLVLLFVPSGSDLLKEQTFKTPIRSRTVEDGRTNNHSHYINSTSKSLFILLPICHKKTWKWTPEIQFKFRNWERLSRRNSVGFSVTAFNSYNEN